MNIPETARRLLDTSWIACRIFDILSATDAPTTKAYLIAETGANDREIRACISDMRLAGIRIASYSGGAGYWLCRSERDYTRLRHEYLSRIATYSKIIKAMDNSVAGQVELDLDGQIQHSALRDVERS